MDVQAESSSGGRARRRRAVACEPCRQSKLRCDRNRPCSSCLRSRNKTCYYAQSDKVAAASTSASASASASVLNRALEQSADGVGPGTNAPSSRQAVPTQASDAAIVACHGPDRELEPTSFLTPGTWHSSTLGSLFVAGQSRGPSQVRALPTSSSLTTDDEPLTQVPRRPEHQNHQQIQEQSAACPSSSRWILSLGRLSNPIRGIMVKGRYFGQSHWLHSVTLFPDAINWLNQEMVTKSESYQLLRNCKSLAKLVKSQRQPNLCSSECSRSLPAKAIADQLLASYLRTFESLYRIVHVPTFKLEYEHCWQDPTPANSLAILKIQLCLGIGACFFDSVFSLRSQTLQWIHEANSWLMSSEKSRLTICGLQILSLLQLVRQNSYALHGDLVWVSAGTLCRTAVRMGLHLDPSKLPKMSVFEAEIRRRLWATIIELLLESTIESGSPPMVSLDEFNCEPPSNLDDNQLGPDTNVDSVPHAPEAFTDTSLQIALWRSQGTRLAIAKLSNNVHSQGSYEEILRLSAELTTACRELTAHMRSFGSKVSLFQSRLCEMTTQRYFLTLHLPYMQLAMSDPLYYFSRKVCVDTALSISYAAFAPSLDGDPTLAALHTAAKTGPACEEYVRLVLCGSGPFRSVPFQSVMVIAAELLAIVQEEAPSVSSCSAGRAAPFWSSALVRAGGSLRSLELHTLLRVAVKWTERRILAGETNVKDYVFIVVILAEIEALISGSISNEARQARGQEAFRHSETILRNMAREEARSSYISPETGPEDDEIDEIGDFWMNEFQDMGWDNLAPVPVSTL